MLNHVSNNLDLYTNSTIKQQQEILGVDKREVNKNPYAKIDGFVDQSDISELAKKLYEKDRETLKFAKLVTDDLNNISDSSKITDFINSGSYISNDELADSLLNNNDFLSMFSGK